MKKIVINHTLWQTRIAIVRDDNKLQNMYFDSHTNNVLERSFFKGVIIKILPGLQTAFVDIGEGRAGFLHISEIDRTLALKRMGKRDEEMEVEEEDIEEDEDETSKTQASCPLNITKIFHEGEHVLVQVSKEPVYEKGPKLTTCFTLPGRFIVLMPNIPRIGVSKKIEDQDERLRLRTLFRELLPKGMGAIIRTPSEGRKEEELKNEVNFFLAQWEEIQKGFKEVAPKTLIHRDIDMALQSVRDNLDNDVEMVICDDKEIQSKLYKFIKRIAPEHAQKVSLYTETGNAFDLYNIEKQLQSALEKKVILKSGGSLIIETTEAMTVVDVNTGRYIGSKNLEETLFNTNIEAAEEVVRQLRLRNIGGIIVIDFIDMMDASHRAQVYRYMERMLREKDKFQSVVLKISEFGLVQMTRKRTGKTLSQQMMETCPMCRGLGVVSSVKNEAYRALRILYEGLIRGVYGPTIHVSVHKDVFHYLVEHEYDSLLLVEKMYGKKVVLAANEGVSFSFFSIQ